MEQLSINWQQQAIQPRELARVKAAIARLILEFIESRGVGGRFHMAELTAYVSKRVTTAPDSAGRVLRDLRQAGEVNYSVENRRQSLYVIEEV